MSSQASTSGRPVLLCAAGSSRRPNAGACKFALTTQSLMGVLLQPSSDNKEPSTGAQMSSTAAAAQQTPSTSSRDLQDADGQQTEAPFVPGMHLRAGRYCMGTLLHKSPRSEVWKAQRLATGEEVVVKAVAANTPERRRRALQEAVIHSQLQPPQPAAADRPPVTAPMPRLGKTGATAALHAAEAAEVGGGAARDAEAMAMLPAVGGETAPCTAVAGVPAPATAEAAAKAPKAAAAAAAGPGQLLEWFVAEGGPTGAHVCLVMGPLHQTAAWLLHFLGRKGRRGLPMPAVRNMARQLLGTLDHMHSQGIVHRDVKLTNLLLVQPFTKRVDTEGDQACASKAPHPRMRTMGVRDVCIAQWQLIDYGNAARLHRPWYWCGLGRPQAREPPQYDTPAYAPPEAILQVPATSAFDMWSAGCLLYEAATGSPLFDIQEGEECTADEHHLWMIKQLTGQPSLKLLDRSPIADQYYDSRGILHLERGNVLRPRRLYATLREVARMPQQEAKAFADFLQPMLAYNPDARPTAAQQLQHPWLSIEEDNDEDSS